MLVGDSVSMQFSRGFLLGSEVGTGPGAVEAAGSCQRSWFSAGVCGACALQVQLIQRQRRQRNLEVGKLRKVRQVSSGRCSCATLVGNERSSKCSLRRNSCCGTGARSSLNHDV